VLASRAMSTLPFAPPGPAPAPAAAQAPVQARRAPAALAIALLALVLYAAFSHGAGSLTTGARIEVALAVVAVLAGIAGLWFGTLRLAAPRLALSGIALLTAFAAWSGVTVLWSVAPDQTWVELNRALTYVIVLCLAIALGASDTRAREWVVRGFVGVALAVTAYALTQKLIPGLHVTGLFNLNQTGPLPRLQEPFGYWNALALFVTLGVPTALVLALDRGRRRGERLVGLVAVELMLLVIAFTYSRGAVIALVLALAVIVWMSGASLRALMWLGVAALGLLAPLVLGLADHSLTTANVPLDRRESAGLVLTVVLLASTAAMVLGAARLMQLEATVNVSQRRIRTITRVLIGAVGVLIVVAVLAVALSSRGLTGTVSHAWHSFTTTRATSVYRPDRLLSVDSENRWVWWREAAGAFRDRPLAGWGAGSFGVVHLLYRRDTLTVNQPHSVPLQFLAETGVVGALLALVGLGLLLAAGVRAVRRLPPGSPRLLAASLLAGAFAYAVHALYDWDWDIPGVTFPALLMLGVLVAARHPPPSTSVPRLGGWGAGPRALAMALLTLGLCSFALSAALPSLAATKAADAVVEAASSSPTAVRDAQATAALASRLDPLSDAGLRVEATLAIRRGNPDQARRYLLEAIARDPTDGQAWRELAFEELALGNTRDGLLALGRVLALDPHAADARQLANYIAAIRAEKITPARDSATAHPVGQS
jgi:O-Antigen ligase/Tetratricopeptide repeat